MTTNIAGETALERFTIYKNQIVSHLDYIKSRVENYPLDNIDWADVNMMLDVDEHLSYIADGFFPSHNKE